MIAKVRVSLWLNNYSLTYLLLICQHNGQTIMAGKLPNYLFLYQYQICDSKNGQTELEEAITDHE